MYNFLFILVNLLFWAAGLISISMLIGGQLLMGLLFGVPFAAYCFVAIPLGSTLIKDYLTSKIRGMKKYQY